MAQTRFSGPVVSDNGFVGAFTSTEIILQSNNSNTITLDAPNGLAASYSLIFPPNDGTNGQALITDGSGVTSWSSVGSFTTLTATSVGVTNTSSSTSLFEPVVVSSTLTGVGVTGGRSKFATTINAAAGSFSNALKADVTYGASGSTTGLGSAFVAEMTLSAGTSAGTYAPVEIELNAASTASTGTLTSLIHASVNGTGADSVVNANGVLVNLVGMTNGSAGDTDMVTAPGGNFAATDLTSGIGIKVKVGANFYYIPLVAAADYQDN